MTRKPYDDSIRDEVAEGKTLTIEQVRRWFVQTNNHGYDDESELVSVIRKGLLTRTI